MTTPAVSHSFTSVSKSAAAEAPASKYERVRAKAESHYERNASGWIASKYRELLLKEAPSPALRPEGTTYDRKSHLYRAATLLVKRKQEIRLARIDRAVTRQIDRELGRGR